MKEIVLASTSPRRRELLENIGLIFKTVSPKFDESLINKTFSYEKIEEIAEKKCESVLDAIKTPSLIISADTVVVNDNIVLGKPKDYEEAFKMLSSLSDKEHKVVTSICIMDTEFNKKIIKSTTSEVTFNNLSSSDIKYYIEEFEPYDKAGSYGIQELPDSFINGIKGDYDNIVGLPVRTLIDMMSELKIV